MWQKIKDFFSSIDEKVQNKLDQWFKKDDAEKRNILGWAIGGCWGLIKLPFKLVKWTVDGTYLLFTNPGELGKRVWFNMTRFFSTMAVLTGLKNADGTLDEMRFLLGFWAFLIGVAFAPIFFEVGMVKTGIAFLVVPLGGWFLSGLEQARDWWSIYTPDYHETQRAARKANVRLKHAMDQAAAERNIRMAADLAQQQAEREEELRRSREDARDQSKAASEAYDSAAKTGKSHTVRMDAGKRTVTQEEGPKRVKGGTIPGGRVIEA